MEFPGSNRKNPNTLDKSLVMGLTLFTSILTHYMLHKIKSFFSIVLKEYSVIIKWHIMILTQFQPAFRHPFLLMRGNEWLYAGMLEKYFLVVFLATKIHWTTIYLLENYVCSVNGEHGLIMSKRIKMGFEQNCYSPGLNYYYYFL